MRLNRDISKVFYYKISENFACKTLPYLDLEAHYSFIEQKNRGAKSFKNTNRLEFELNPFFTFDNGITCKWRNRLELAKRQGVSRIQFVARHRCMISFPIENYGSLTSVNMYEEIFYDFDTNQFNQNRFTPIELSFIFNREMTLNLFLMLRDFYNSSSERWYRSIVLGTGAAF
jgi:hypothetical protein